MGITTTDIFFFLLLTALLAGLVLIVHGSIVKNDWGINLDPVVCPRCNTRLDQTDLSKSFRQRLWGGYTCLKCGSILDKWGREIAPGRGLKLTGHIETIDRTPLTFKKLLLRNCLSFAPALYLVRVWMEQPTRLQYRLLHPIPGVIFSTIAFTALLKGIDRTQRAQQGKNIPPTANEGNQSVP